MMRDDDEKTDRDEEDKENLEDSRAETSMSNSTCLPTTGRVENMEATVDSNGKLDLSQQRLTNLARNFKEEYARVRHLDVHGNDFQMFTYMKMFEKCEILDVSDCQINKFAAEFNENLRSLNLAGNQLKQVAQLSRFENLTALDLSQNHIEENIVLSLKKLETLNLSCNSLDRLPDLSKCSTLRSLNLSGNRINDLTYMSQLICPNHLSDLWLSANLIEDLSQFSNLSAFKKLVYVYIAGNPCITDVIKSEKFNYRSYIFACCSENLELIDDEEIEDEVKMEGEWLVIQGGIRKIGVGNHQELCEKLSQHFPKDDQVPPTPAQKSCHKAMEKRKSSQIDSDRTVNSVYSPFRDWNGKLEKQVNLNRSLGTDDMLTPIKRIPRQMSSGSSNLRMCSPPEARKNRSFTFRNQSPIVTLPEEIPEAGLQNYSRTNSTETVILSSRTETCLSLDDRSEITPLPVIEDAPPTVTSSALEAEEADKTKSRSVSAATNRRSPSVADVSIVAEPNNHLAERVRHLERKVTELARQNENLTTTNNLLTEMLEEFQKDRMKMWETIRASIPRPENMSSSLYAEAEDGLQTHIVRWEMPLVKGFEIHVDGNSCGRVVGKNNSARITDLDASKPHNVQIQAIGLSGEKGVKSAKLRIDADVE